MSKLDYITIGIVALCIMAIIFLVYKMTNVFKSDTPTDKTETTAGTVETEGDIYNYEADSTSSGETVSDSTASPASTPATKPATEDYEDHTPPAVDQPATQPQGKFMVIAGAFSKKALAQAEANKMKKQGYSNARVEIFDRGKFAVILVDRFDTMAQAERLVKELRDRGIESYVKTKETAN